MVFRDFLHEKDNTRNKMGPQSSALDTPLSDPPNIHLAMPLARSAPEKASKQYPYFGKFEYFEGNEKET